MVKQMVFMVLATMLAACDPMGGGSDKPKLNPGSYEYSTVIYPSGTATTLKFRESFSPATVFRSGIFLDNVLVCETTQGTWKQDGMDIHLTGQMDHCLDDNGVMEPALPISDKDETLKDITTNSFQIFLSPPPSAEAFGAKRGWVTFVRVGD